MSVSFCCPFCYHSLENSEHFLRCALCQRSYKTVDGIPNFCEEDVFYEGKWVQTDESQGSLRNLLVKKERFFLQQLRGKKGTVLDLGCGGGWKLFTRVGAVTGIDVSLGSLRNAQRIYQRVAMASLTALPFPKESFDFVVSLDVFGHIPQKDKGKVLAEIHRILRKGGRTLHYIETEGKDPLMRFAKSFPDLYDKYIIAPEGHIGLEPPTEVLNRFRQVGFRPVMERIVYRGLMYVGRFVQLFDNEYKKTSKIIHTLLLVAKAIERMGPLAAATNVVISLLIEIGDLLLPPSWGGGVMVCYEKI